MLRIFTFHFKNAKKCDIYATVPQNLTPCAKRVSIGRPPFWILKIKLFIRCILDRHVLYHRDKKICGARMRDHTVAEISLLFLLFLVKCKNSMDHG